MKSKVAFALIACLVMASTSFAAIGMNYDFEDMGNGLVQFSVYAFGTDGDKPSVIDGINVAGGQGVHNVALPAGGIAAVVFDSDWNDYMMDPALKALDSHFITPASGYQPLGPNPTETNDGSNPAGIPALNSYSMPYLAGMGTLNSAVDTALGFTADASGQTYVLQAVTTLEDALAGNVVVTGFVRAGGIDEAVELALVVPEPSTIIMLVLGALCLVGIRIRK